MKIIVNGLISCIAFLSVIFVFILSITGVEYFSGVVLQAYKAILLACLVAFIFGLLIKNKPLIYPLAVGSMVGILSGMFYVYVVMFNI